MTNTRDRSFALALIVACSLLSPRTSQGQTESPASPAVLYERGVNAYFAGRSSEAERYLSEALAANSLDPRPYYFRALCLLRLGRSDYARGDMMAGAEIEAQSGNRFAVGRALERVQGANRLLLEQFRRQARADAAAGIARIERRLRPVVDPSVSLDDMAVLRQRVLVPLERFNPRAAQASLPVQPTGERSPAASGRPTVPANDPDIVQPAADNPFQDDPAPAPERSTAAAPRQQTESAENHENETVPDADIDPFGEL